MRFPTSGREFDPPIPHSRNINLCSNSLCTIAKRLRQRWPVCVRNAQAGRAERAVLLTSSVRIGACGDAKTRLGCGGSRQKVERKFWGCFCLPIPPKTLHKPLSESRGLFRAFFGLVVPEALRVYKVRGGFIHAHTTPPHIGHSLRSRGLLGGVCVRLVTSLEFVVLKVRASCERKLMCLAPTRAQHIGASLLAPNKNRRSSGAVFGRLTLLLFLPA